MDTLGIDEAIGARLRCGCAEGGQRRGRALAGALPRAMVPVSGIGHNLPQEAPLDFVHAIEEVDNFA